MAKRTAAGELNHDNWDREEKHEEAGTFTRAEDNVLQKRVMKTAKRRLPESTINPFSGFSGFGGINSSADSTPFSFLNKNTNSKSEEKSTEGSESTSISTGAESQPKNLNKQFFSITPQNDSISKTNSSNESGKTAAPSDTFKPFENVFKASAAPKESEKNSRDLEVLRDLNLSCSAWIAEHLEKNPYCILTPIFKDYEKHLSKLNVETESKGATVQFGKVSSLDSPSNGSPKTFSLSKGTSSDAPKLEEKRETIPEAKTEGLSQIPTFNFKPSVPGGLGASLFGALSSTPTFSLTNISQKPPGDASKKDEEESEEPPKNDFVPVVEDDSIFDIRCKVFIKKDGGYASKGVGTLFIKPVKDINKNQLIVRGDTSLGTILLNVLLTPSLPIQKTGSNNVMIVCLPTHDAKPPPVPVLIRVKTSEDCDKVIKKLEECRGS